MILEDRTHNEFKRLAPLLKKYLVENGEANAENPIPTLIEKFQNDCWIKFILVLREDQTILRIFSRYIMHTDAIEKGASDQPIGAGALSDSETNKGKVTWGSNSFLHKFGFDRPKNQETADSLLAEVKATFDKWIEEICNNA